MSVFAAAARRRAADVQQHGAAHQEPLVAGSDAVGTGANGPVVVRDEPEDVVRVVAFGVEQGGDEACGVRSGPDAARVDHRAHEPYAGVEGSETAPAVLRLRARDQL